MEWTWDGAGHDMRIARDECVITDAGIEGFVDTVDMNPNRFPGVNILITRCVLAMAKHISMPDQWIIPANIVG